MKPPKSGRRLLRRFLPGAVLGVSLGLLAGLFVISPFQVPSDSMQGTLHAGDRVLVSKLTYSTRNPNPGDIVVFHAPKAWTTTKSGEGALIERVIATAGQSIRCCDAKGRLEIKAVGSSRWVPLDEPYLRQSGPLAERRFVAVTVPQGRIWVMSDSRPNLADSLWHLRHPSGETPVAIGATVPKSAVIGRAVCLAWPLGRVSNLGTPDTFKGKHLAGPQKVNLLLIQVPLLLLLVIIVLLPLAWARDRITTRRRGRAKQAEQEQVISTRGTGMSTRHSYQEDGPR